MLGPVLITWKVTRAETRGSELVYRGVRWIDRPIPYPLTIHPSRLTRGLHAWPTSPAGGTAWVRVLTRERLVTFLSLGCGSGTRRPRGVPSSEIEGGRYIYVKEKKDRAKYTLDAHGNGGCLKDTLRLHRLTFGVTVCFYRKFH